jgi:CRISPR-associated endonuclease/helicase Cas3
MTTEKLLAKSLYNGHAVTLAQHSRDTAESFRLLFGEVDAPTRLTRCWLRFFGLSEGDAIRFWRNGWIASALHDLGKANDAFQSAVRRNASQPFRQPFRHEHLSALLLAEPLMCNWLDQQRATGVDLEIIISAVVSHHLKVSPETFASPSPHVLKSDPSVEIYGDAPDIAETLAVAAEAVGSAPPSTPFPTCHWRFSSDISPRRQGFRDKMYAFGKNIRKDERRRRLLLAVKAAVIAADSASSAATRVGIDVSNWLRSVFDDKPLTSEDIEHAVIDRRVEEIRARGRWNGFHDFQIAAASLGPRALLLSGCGTGKTLAAWKWVAAQLDQWQASRVLFLYPTRATAKEGFRDYVSWAGPDEAALVSGTARYDLEGIFDNPRESSDPRVGADFTTDDRLFALGNWDRRFFSATADAFLAMMANRYAALCLVPLLCDSVIVVDEVHSFDRNMFKALDNFLHFFNVPVLCMTASLPRDRLRILREQRCLETFPRETDTFPDLEQQARALRYRVTVTDGDTAATRVREALMEGKRVLWVVNTVRRCQNIAKRLHAQLGNTVTVLCYHSRFRLVDRQARHEKVIAAFRDQQGPLLLVTTQVCEMSLDLDADMLVSEAAPIPSLIQRMGRCCREPLPRPGRIGEVFIYPPDDERPYDKAEVSDGCSFAEKLHSEGNVAQQRLAELLDEMQIRNPQAQGGFSGFLDSGWYALSRDDSFREDDDYTVDAVLDRDRERWLQLRKRKSPEADGLIVPIPRRLSRENPALGQFVRLADGSRYHEAYGYLEDLDG